MGNRSSASMPPPPPPPPPAPPRELTAWEKSGPPGWAILFHKVDIEDYPWIRNTPMLTEYPALAFWELSVLRAIRYAVIVGFVVSPAAWYLHRKRLPFADRPLAKLHHYFFPSAGYATMAGCAFGTMDALWTTHKQFGGPHPGKEAERKLVKAAVLSRMDKENERWCKTGGRLGFYGLVTTFLFWKGGSALFRVAMGFGIGVTAGAVISASRLDKQMELL